MPWIMFALAVGCFAIAINTQSMGLAVLCLLAALGLMLSGALAIISARIQRSGSDSGMQLNPALERHRMKEAAAHANTAPDPDSDQAEEAAPATASESAGEQR